MAAQCLTSKGRTLSPGRTLFDFVEVTGKVTNKLSPYRTTSGNDSGTHTHGCTADQSSGKISGRGHIGGPKQTACPRHDKQTGPSHTEVETESCTLTYSDHTISSIAKVAP